MIQTMQDFYDNNGNMLCENKFSITQQYLENSAVLGVVTSRQLL